MTEHALYNPQAGDFEGVTVTSDIQQLTRPSLSYWQDAWVRLKKNKRAMASLCIVVALILFTLIGPLLWRVDPSAQDLDQISQFITFNKTAVITESQTVWEGITLDNFPAEPEEEPDAWLPGPDENARWTPGHQEAAKEGTEAALALRRLARQWFLPTVWYPSSGASPEVWGARARRRPTTLRGRALCKAAPRRHRPGMQKWRSR